MVSSQNVHILFVFADASEKYEFDPLNPTVSCFVLVREVPREAHNLDEGPKKDSPCQAQAKAMSDKHNIHYNKTSPDIRTSPIKLSKNVYQDVFPKNEQQVLGFIGEKAKTTQVHIPPIKEMTISKQTTNEENYSKDLVDMIVDVSDKKEIESAQVAKFRSLQLAALKKSPFKDILMTLDPDTKQEGSSVDQASRCLNKPSHLKAFSEKEQNVFRLQTGEKGKDDNAVDTVIAIGYAQNNPSSPPQTNYSRLLDVSKDNGTYRGNLVFTNEETKDQLGSGTELQITEPPENRISPEPRSAFNNQKPKCYNPVSPITQSKAATENESFSKLDELRHFWEKENGTPKVFSIRERKTSSKLMSHNNKASIQPEPKVSSESREKFEEEAQMIQNKTSADIIRSLNESNKDFVQPDSSTLRSFDRTMDVEPPCNQDNTKTESEEKTFGLKTIHLPKTKDKENEAKRSPSKTYHPKVLPLERPSAKGYRLEVSPLKTLTIDINLQTKDLLEEPTLDSKQKKSPSHLPKQTVQTNNGEDASSPHPLLSLRSVDRKTCFEQENMEKSSNTSTSQQSEQAPGITLESNTLPARKFTPKDLQYYLGPQEKAHHPPFHQNKDAATADSDAAYKPQGKCGEFRINQSYHPTERKSWIVENKSGNSNPEITTGMWSLSQENSGRANDSL